MNFAAALLSIAFMASALADSEEPIIKEEKSLPIPVETELLA